MVFTSGRLRYLSTLLAALVLVTTAIGVLVFTLTSTDEPSAGSYVTLVVNALLITLFIAADSILFMLKRRDKSNIFDKKGIGCTEY
jgi:divalent metal cation (Fe/Co/Zn/Cd) transporter